MNLKLRGKRLFDGDREVAEIRSTREWVRGTPIGDAEVWQDGKRVAKGFAYFRDAVKWVRDTTRDA